MHKSPLVSIITPSYNQGRFLEATIQSVISQTYPNLEYILIDGGSTDESGQIIEKYSKYLTHWESRPDRGQAHAINKGLAKAKGDILGWLNADDLLLPSTVEIVVNSFLENPSIDVIYGHLDRIDEDGNLISTPVLPKDRVVFSIEYIIGECVVNQPGSFWRREYLEKAGFLDETLRYGLDYEYWIRLALTGAQFKRLSQTVARFRVSERSKTGGETEKMALEQLKILDKVLAIEDLPSKTGLSPQQIITKARKTQSLISLHAFYGYYKKRNIRISAHWLIRALKNDPTILFQSRWFNLALARLSRR